MVCVCVCVCICMWWCGVIYYHQLVSRLPATHEQEISSVECFVCTLREGLSSTTKETRFLGLVSDGGDDGGSDDGGDLEEDTGVGLDAVLVASDADVPATGVDDGCPGSCSFFMSSS